MPKPVPGWVVRLIGAGMILPFIAMIVGKVRPESSPVLFFGSAIAFFAGIFLLRGRTPWVG